MSAQVKYVSYKLCDSQGRKVLETDFSAQLNVKLPIVKIVCEDLISFTFPNSVGPFISTLVIGDGKEQVEITRDFAKKQMEVRPEVDLTQWLRARTGGRLVPAILSDLSLEGVKMRLHMLLAKSRPIPEEQVAILKKQVTDAGGGTTAEAWVKNYQDLTVLEGELARQKWADELQVSTTGLENRLKLLAGQLDSVRAISGKLVKLEHSLSRLGHLQNQDLQAEAARLRTQIYQDRAGALQNLARDEARRPADEPGEQKPPILGRILFLLFIILLVLGFAGYAFTKDSKILISTLLGAVSEVMLLISVNMLPAGLDIHSGVRNAAAFQESKRGVGQMLKDTVSRASRFFVDKAWLDALVHERELLQASIQNKLGEEIEVATLELERAQIDRELSDLKTFLARESTTEIPPMEYARKKREVDTLSVDQERLAEEVKKLANSENIIQAITQFFTNYFATAELPSGLVGPYSKVKSSENALEFWNSQTNTWENPGDVEILQLAYFALVADVWKHEPSLPLLVVNFLPGLSASAQQLINAKIVELQALGQVIIINQG